MCSNKNLQFIVKYYDPMKKTILLMLFLISLIVLAVRLASAPANSLLGIKEKAGIRVLSLPDGAKVYLDDNEIGKTPYESSNLEAREIKVKIEADKGKWEGKVKLQPGTLTVVNRELSADATSNAGEILTLEKGRGVILISTPNESDIEIDGKNLGQTPLRVDVSPGEHTFVLGKGGFLRRSIKAIIPDGFNLTLNVDLALSEADLSNVTTPPITETAKLVVKSTPTGFLRVRDKPSLAGNEVARVSTGDELILLEEQTSWYRIRTADGKEGYVSAQYVQKKP